jgi:predicted PurR-regulated permease PerM
MPVVDWLDDWSVPRWLGVLLVALVGAGLIVLVVLLVAPAIAAQVSELPDMLRETWAELQRLWQRWRVALPSSVVEWVDAASARIESRAGEMMPEASTLTEWASRAAAGVGAFASGIVFVPIFVFLMLRGYHTFVRKGAELVPPRWRARFAERSEQADRVLSGFVRGQLLVAFVIGVLYAIAFTIIGVPLGLVVGLLAGLGELVPYLGGAIALILASLLALAGGEPLDVLWVVVAFAAIQALEGGLISPWIMGRKAQLGPGIVIVSIVLGGELFGFIGLLAAVPAAALLKVAVGAAVDAYRASPFYLRRRAA